MLTAIVLRLDVDLLRFMRLGIPVATLLRSVFRGWFVAEFFWPMMEFLWSFTHPNRSFLINSDRIQRTKDLLTTSTRTEEAHRNNTARIEIVSDRRFDWKYCINIQPYTNMLLDQSQCRDFQIQSSPPMAPLFSHCSIHAVIAMASRFPISRPTSLYLVTTSIQHCLTASLYA